MFFFCLSLVFHGRDIPCQCPAVVVEQSPVPFPLISLFHFRNVLMETLSVFIIHCTTFLWKKSKSGEGSVFLVKCCSIISGSSLKDCLQDCHSFEPFCFPKIILLQILNCPKSPFRRLEGACRSIRP